MNVQPAHSGQGITVRDLTKKSKKKNGRHHPRKSVATIG